MLSHGPWLPALLPAAGFLLLWRQGPLWLDVDEVREATAVLLLLTAALAAVRAYGRRRWTAALRWLVVYDGALAGVLLSSRAVPPWIVVVLWAGAFGTHAYLLAAELAGSTPRRGALAAMLWRLTAWVATTALSWPLLAAAGGLGPRRSVVALAAGGLTAGLAAWVNVARLVEAPERRALARPGSGLSLAHVAPAVMLAGVPLALAGAWWVGFAPRPLFALLALVPPLVGGGLALAALRPAEPGPGARAGQRAQHVARGLFRVVVVVERALVGWVIRLLRLLATAAARPAHRGRAGVPPLPRRGGGAGHPAAAAAMTASAWPVAPAFAAAVLLAARSGRAARPPAPRGCSCPRWAPSCWPGSAPCRRGSRRWWRRSSPRRSPAATTIRCPASARSSSRGCWAGRSCWARRGSRCWRWPPGRPRRPSSGACCGSA